MMIVETLRGIIYRNYLMVLQNILKNWKKKMATL